MAAIRISSGVRPVVERRERRGVALKQEWEIRPVIDPAERICCAGMMATTDPWKYFKVNAEKCLHSLGSPDIRIHVAMAGDVVKGFLASMEHGVGFAPLLKYLCVAPEWRNQGVGRSLVAYFEEVLFPDEMNLFLFVSDINPSAARLYRSLDYAQVGALPNYNHAAQTEYMFRKTRGPKLELRTTL
jgi:ribosomal protein S18 acetylase RimI-like enzyme